MTLRRSPFRLVLSSMVAAVLATSASPIVLIAREQGGYLTRNGFRAPIYGVSQVLGANGMGSSACTTLTAPQVDAARFDRQVSRAMLVSLPLAVVSAAGGATFNVTYTDPDGAGFKDGGLGEARRGAFEAALAAWAKVIRAPQPIAVQAAMTEMDDGDDNPLTTLLATAGPTEFWLLEGKLTPSSLAWQKLGRRNNTAQGSDFTVQANSAANWDYALDGTAEAGKASLMYVLMHEIGHGLGLVDSFDATTGRLMNEPLAFVYDGFVNRGSVARNPVTGHGGEERVSDLSSNDLFFNGANAVKAIGASSQPAPMVKLHAPDPYQPGTSVAHVAPEAFAEGATGLMVPKASAGSALIDGVTLAIMKDLGYQLVPGAATARARN